MSAVAFYLWIYFWKSLVRPTLLSGVSSFYDRYIFTRRLYDYYIYYTTQKKIHTECWPARHRFQARNG